MAHNRVSKGLGIFCTVTFVAGCASGGGMAASDPGLAADAMAAADPVIVSTPELVAEGQALFGQRCVICHGNTGAGGAFGPDLTDDAWAWIDSAVPSALSELANLIRTGITEPRVSDTGMPPMGGGNFDDAQLNALAAYVLSL
jgi:mono/diheme cytochrome c family protein